MVSISRYSSASIFLEASAQKTMPLNPDIPPITPLIQYESYSPPTHVTPQNRIFGVYRLVGIGFRGDRSAHG